MRIQVIFLMLFAYQASAQVSLPSRSMEPVIPHIAFSSQKSKQLPSSPDFVFYSCGAFSIAYPSYLRTLRLQELLPIRSEERIFPVKRPYRINRAIPRNLVQWVMRDQLDADDLRFEILNEYYRTEQAELSFSARQDLTYVLP